MVGVFYVTMVQAVLLFGYDTWVLNRRLEESLVDFHHWAFWWMEVMGTKRKQDGTWV